MTGQHRRNLRNGLLFASPWLIGIAAFLAYPLLFSLYTSFCDYSTLEPPVWVGMQNYTDLVRDPLIYKSLGNTLAYGAIALPGTLIVAMAMALLLHANVRGASVFRTIFYLPCLVPAVAAALLWLWVFNGEHGILNYGIGRVLGGGTRLLNETGIANVAPPRPPMWLGDPMWAKPALALMAIWSAGSTMIIYLAGLQDVPVELYEAAEIDGAGWWRRLVHVTLPCLSPLIYFTLIVGLIAVLQIFTPAYIMGGGPSGGTIGGPARSTLFYTLYLWAQAFEWLRMGYASAMAWMLFVVIVILTLAAHRIMSRRMTTG